MSDLPDAPKPPESASAPLATADDLRGVWDSFRAGGVVPCPRDAAPLALAVDAAAGVYRFVCTRCGVASAWFEAGPGTVRIRAQAMPPAGRATEE